MSPPRPPASYAAADRAPAAPPISPCTSFKIRSLARQVSQLYDDMLAPCGLRGTQYSLLAHARRPRGDTAPTVTELAAVMFTDRTTLTRNLKPLLAAGLVRLESGADARSKNVVVTPAGEQAWREARELWKRAQARVREIAGAGAVGELEALIDGMLPKFDGGNRGES